MITFALTGPVTLMEPSIPSPRWPEMLHQNEYWPGFPVLKLKYAGWAAVLVSWMGPTRLMGDPSSN